MLSADHARIRNPHSSVGLQRVQGSCGTVELGAALGPAVACLYQLGQTDRRITASHNTPLWRGHNK